MTPNVEFITRVMPWPVGDNSPGYVNLHWTMTNARDPKRAFWSGKPTRSVDEFVRMTEWAKSRAQIRDIYFCLSLQAKASTNKRGNSKVQRAAVDALFVKAIWLDIDVKDPPKGYSTIAEALDALTAFIGRAGLPKASALIASGGGLHVYWISDRPLTVDQWRPYAEGLKALAVQHGLRCDAGCTSDVARILRVPNTFNYKTDPPRAVRVLGLGADYDFSTALVGIAKYTPVTATVTVSAPSSFLAGKPADAFLAKPIESLAAGLDKEESPPLAAAPMIKACPFFKDAFLTGGKDHSQPLWNLTILSTTFLEKGDALAHAFGNKHPGYTKESTDAMYQRKLKERNARDLGWPSCSKFEGEGSKQCAGCPFRGKIKSPLSLAGQQQVVQLNVPTVPIAMADPSLPEGYVLDKDGHICFVEEIPSEDGAPPETNYYKLFSCKIGTAHVQHDPDFISFTASTDIDNFTRANIPFEQLASAKDVCQTLLKNKVIYYSRNKLHLEHFFMAWITKLHNAQKATVAQPFGWYREGGEIKGFSYGGTLMKDDGTEQPAGIADKETSKQYTPQGSLQKWFDAYNVLANENRPGLDVLVASSFGAPLLTNTGENSGLLSVWGDSGGHKSSAVSVALAIWGHPKLTREVIQTTSRSAVKKLGNINNLPLYWDEIKDETIQAKVYDSLYSATLGVGAGRLNSNAEQKAKDVWQTLMCICANRSFVDYVVKRDKTTDAGLYRVFEFEHNRLPHGYAGQLMTHEATVTFSNLFHNYGMMGLKYAKYLALNHKAIVTAMSDLQKRLSTEMNGTDPERFWFAVMASCLMGAKLANDLGCRFDIERMEKFLKEWLVRNRLRNKEEALQGGSLINTEEIITGFHKEYMDQQVYTNTYHVGQGKPKPVTVIWGPRLDLGKPIQIHWVVMDRLLRISKKALTDYMDANDIPPAQVLRGLKDNFRAETVFARLAGGTPYRGGQEHLIHVPVPPGSVFEELLLAHSSDADKQKLRDADGEKTVTDTLGAATAQAHADLELVKRAAAN